MMYDGVIRSLPLCDDTFHLECSYIIGQCKLVLSRAAQLVMGRIFIIDNRHCKSTVD